MSNAYDFLYSEDLYSIKDPILIILDKPWESIPEDEKALLSKILGSIRLTLDHVTILHESAMGIEMLKIYQPCRVISFGVKLSEAHPPYQYHLSPEVSFIQADSLGTLTDITKKNLWVALKAGFLATV